MISVKEARKSYQKKLPKENRSEAREVNMWMERFEFCYQKSSSDLQRLQDLQNIYDNVVNYGMWPTTSKIPIPLLFTMVEKALPEAFEYCFPHDNFLRLRPAEPNIPIERIERSEFALHQTLLYKMRLPWHALPTIKDCFKLGLGYGIVEPISISPPASFTNQATNGTATIRAKTMGFASPRRAIRYRHITPGQIIVSKDGSDFNGPKRVSHTFFFDSYTEQQFADMYAESAVDGEKPELMGNPKAIIEEARSLGFFSTVPIPDLVAALTGQMLNAQEADYRFPIQVPVLKIYTPHEHVWIANGTRIISRQVDRYQTYATPCSKCSAWPDGDRWYPMSSVEAAQGMVIGANFWMNAILDLVTQVIKPTMAYDKNLTGGRPPERGPNNEIGMAGPVRDAIHYLEQPRVDPAIFTIGDTLMRWYGSTVGQEEFLNQASPGVVRGGMFAFESLLQSTTGRQKMAGAILDMGFIEAIARQTLVQMQMNIADGPETFASRKYDQKTGKYGYEYKTVTEEDLVNAFDLEVDLREKMRNSAAEHQTRLAEFDRLNNDPYTDQHMLRTRLVGSSADSERLFFSRERVAAIQEERRKAEQAAIAAGAQQRPGLPSTTTAEQAAAGAAGGGR